MSDECDEHDLTLHLPGAPTEALIRVSHKRIQLAGKGNGPVLVRAPSALVFVHRGNSDFFLLIHFPRTFGVTRERDRATYKKAVEALTYAAPRISETDPRAAQACDPLPHEQNRLHAIDVWDPADPVAWKEQAAGETYEQRSHMCYEDASQIARAIWRDPRKQAKEFSLHDLRKSSTKRRIYEDSEWLNVLRWGEGEGYWSDESEQVTRGERVSKYVIEGSQMRQLEARLSRAELGVLPEIVGRIDLSSGLSFLQGDLRDSVLRDCREINEAAKVGAAKGVIVMCGSVVEALLYDVVKADEQKAQAKVATIPAVKGWADRPVDQWTAFPIIKVARELEPTKVGADAAAYADVLRDYRNLIHPGKAERSSKAVDQHTAAIAISVVNLLIGGLVECTPRTSKD